MKSAFLQDSGSSGFHFDATRAADFLLGEFLNGRNVRRLTRRKERSRNPFVTV